jgi:hypothetical protein
MPDQASIVVFARAAWLRWGMYLFGKAACACLPARLLVGLQVVDFYNSRDVKPRCKSAWTPVDVALKQGCWPEPEYPQTVNRAELGNLQLSRSEQQDLVAFMETLSDRDG